MKKILLAISILGAMLMTIDVKANGTVTVGGGAYQNGVGGEFTVTPSPDLAYLLNNGYVMGETRTATSFQSFCIEWNEHLSLGGTYAVDSIIQNAIQGNQGPLGDPISVGTAWLYHQFQIGQLVGIDANGNRVAYDYSNINGQRNNQAGQLQNTLWWLENEPVGVGDPGNGNIFRNEVLAMFGTQAAAEADNAGLYPVAVMNLGPNSENQDILVCVPDGGLTAMLLGMGMLGLGWVRRMVK